jgi:hypothetical protein
MRDFLPFFKVALVQVDELYLGSIENELKIYVLLDK